MKLEHTGQPWWGPWDGMRSEMVQARGNPLGFGDSGLWEFLGTLALWDLGTLALWDLGTLVDLGLGILGNLGLWGFWGFWDSAIVGLWDSGTLQFCDWGTLGCA